MKKIFFVTMLCLGLILSACGANKSASVVGTWNLVSLGEAAALKSPAAGTAPTVTFNDDGSFGGNVGCNTFGGKYKVSGNEIIFSEVVSTMMACEEPLMNQESFVLGLLSGETTFNYEEANSTLVILSLDEARAIALQK